MTVSASHTSIIPAHLLAVCVLSGRRALGGAARCRTVAASRAHKQASRIRRRVDIPSRHQVAEQHLVESGRRVRLMSRIVDVVELSELERFSIFDNHRRNHRRQGGRFPDNTDFSTELSVSQKQMGASRKDEFGKCN